MLVERVSEAQRFARIEMKEQGEQHRKRPRGGDAEGDDTEQSSGVRKKGEGVGVSGVKFFRKGKRGKKGRQVMDFLIGSPFATPVGHRIERATSSSLQSEDWGLNMEICDIINETEEGPKDAVRALKKRIVGNKNFREVMLALTVLETCVKNCGHRFHVLVSTRGFVEGVLVRAIMPKLNPPMVLQDRVLSLIQAWADAFRTSPSLTGVVAVYEDLRKRGLVFPAATNTASPIHTPHEDVRSALKVSAPPPQPAASSSRGGALTLSPDQVKKLRSDLEVVRGNMTVMSEMMNQLVPGQAQDSDIELLQQLYSVCKSTQDRVVKLIPRLSDESLIEELLTINDEFNTTFIHYHSFEEHCNRQDPPEQEQSPAAEPTCDNLIDLDSDTPTVHQPVLPAVPAPEPLCQSPVNTLSSQMSNLSTGTDDEFDMFALSRSKVQAQQEISGQNSLEEQSSDPGQNGALDIGAQTSASIPVSEDSVMDDIEKWLCMDVEDDPSDGVTSEEFNKFLELRAKAAESLPSVSAMHPSSATPILQSAQQQAQSPDQMSAL
ncbi:hypothetical protein GJAV_G00218080 [Gymnothorax javanicus]|nr:hypothetical protein GJAV_G00218080 [Gymnothorax javanicus]